MCSPMHAPTRPFAPGSIIYKPYVCDGDADARIDDLLGDAAHVADEMVTIMHTTAAQVLNLRVHVPGLAPADVIHQIELIGAALPLIRAGWALSGPA